MWIRVGQGNSLIVLAFLLRLLSFYIATVTIPPVVLTLPGHQDESEGAMEGEHTEWDDEGFGGGGGGGATFILRLGYA